MASDPASAISARLSHWVRADPGAPAMGAVDGPMLSRGQLSALMCRGRRFLRGAGLGPSDRVAALMPEGVAGAVVALQVAGACSLAPLRPSPGAAGWAAALRHLSPSALVVSTDWPEAAEAATALGVPVFDPAELGSAETVFSAESSDTGKSELLLATSGSTGPPKWVRIPQRGLVVGSGATGRCLQLTPDDRALLALPLTHAHGLVSGLLLPLLNGGSVVVAEGFEPRLFLTAVAEQAITWFTLAPAMHRALLEQHAVTPLARDHRLRFVRSGSVTLPPAVINALATEFGVPVIEAYGMTECPNISSNPADSPRPGSVGRPVVGELAVVGGDHTPVPAGEWGQVVLRGAPLMSGYLDSNADASVFRNGWLQTGDEGRLDDDGYLFLRGRIGERINRGGVMVAPAEVDAALLSHTDVRQAVAFAVPHTSLGEDLAAAVILKIGSAADATVLRSHIAARLESSHVPSAILIVDTLPVGVAGKVVRGDLADALSAELHPDYEAPLDVGEAAMLDLFVSVLGSRGLLDVKLGRHSNFFLEGGDSLAAVQVMARLARSGRGEHPARLLVENPTPALLARAVESSPNASGSHLVPLQPQGARPPIFIVHGISGVLAAGFADLARALGPDRPVFALHNAGFAPEAAGSTTVAELADRYAQQILESTGTGPIHLIGYSAGGWYAHAVAHALLRRGAQVGMLAVLESVGPIAMPRSSRIMLIPSGVRRVLGELRRPAPGRRRRELVRDLVRRVVEAAASTGTTAESASPWAWNDPFRQLLVREYRPPRVPLTADLFATPRYMAFVRQLWRPHVSGIRSHPMFEHHKDFARPDLVGQLAGRLGDILARTE